MTWPPAILRLRVCGGPGQPVRLWIPLFLLWPLVAVLALLALPILLVAALVTRRGSRPRTIVRALPAVWPVICAARGLLVDVQDAEQTVHISIR